MADAVTQAIDQQVNSHRIEEVDDCLTPTDQILLSIAVSIKRIADMLDHQIGKAGPPNIRTLLAGIEMNGRSKQS